MNLYQISAEYQQILENLYDDEGNLNEQELIKFEENQVELNAKAVTIASYIKNLDAERKAIDEAKKQMADREKRYEKKISHMETYLKNNMERCGITKITHPYFDINLKRCPPSVFIEDINLLPTEYFRYKTEISPDKVKIKEEFLNGVVIPGVTIKSNTRIVIK